MQITSHTKLLELLNEYPALEEQIIEIAPPFKNLKNPVLRRTVGQLATLGQVAQIGNIDVTELVNTLRRAAGQPELRVDADSKISIPAKSADDPDWIVGEPQFIVNGIELLRQGDVPLQRVNELLVSLSSDRFILLVTDFEPTPMLDAMNKQNRRFFHKPHPDAPGQFLTFIR
jgi:hypothetical protein